MAAFIIRRNDKEQFWFVMRANNNKTILVSEMYQSKQAAEKGIASIKKEAASAEIKDETAQPSDASKDSSLGRYKETE